MNVMFTVQGEGRGHMTQAIAMSQMLKRRGHRVVAVLADQNQSRQLPDFFAQAFDVPVTPMASPGFVMKQGRGVSLPATGRNVLRNLSRYRRSLALIGSKLTTTRPDLVVNFLEPLMGIYNLRQHPKVPVLAVGHQFMLDHPAFPPLARWRPQRLGMRWYVALTGARSTRLALSFYRAADDPARRVFVSPPILRQQLFDLPARPAGDFLLIYLLNHGYADDIRRWHRHNPSVPIHCFYDKPTAFEEERVDDTLTFHRLHGEKFLRLMNECRGVACSAGFESVSEAVYLGKSLLMVPTENHFEQELNARDAEQARLGARDTQFNLDRLLAAPDPQVVFAFRHWVDQAEEICMRAVERTATRSPETSPCAARHTSNSSRKPGTRPA
jgi:uncharacterized protein (TIGR00661 family)